MLDGRLRHVSRRGRNDRSRSLDGRRMDIAKIIPVIPVVAEVVPIIAEIVPVVPVPPIIPSDLVRIQLIPGYATVVDRLVERVQDRLCAIQSRIGV